MAKKKEDIPGYAVKENGECRAVGGESWCNADEKFNLEPTAPKVQEINVETLRLIAYADPINGCDRYNSEALSVVAAGGSWDDDDVKLLQAKAIEVKKAIQEQFPYADEGK